MSLSAAFPAVFSPAVGRAGAAGVRGDATLASAAKGSALLERIADAAADHLIKYAREG